MSFSQSQLDAFEKELKQLVDHPLGRRQFLAGLSLLLASCATPSQHRLREGDNSGQNTSLTVDDEIKMTNEVLPQMQKDYPPLQNNELQTYIRGLGRRIASANNLEGQPYNYNFTVVNVNYVNAFALPAGTVFVTAPLIEMAESEAELAGVIGHEIGHIKARHTAERMDKAKREQEKSSLYTVGGGLLGGALGYGLGRLACAPKDDACLKKATELGLGAGAIGGMLVQKYAFMANSREDEMEADRIGFKTALNAGYSKDHVGLFYSKLLKMEQERKSADPAVLKSFADAMSTHPPSKERVSQMNQMAMEQSNASNAIVSSIAFEKAQKICKSLKK
jgi:beta-barrel assembly-enhancing protease